MNIYFSHYGITVSISGLGDDLDVSEVIEQLSCLLLAAGFARSGIRDGFRAWLDEHNAEDSGFEVE